jgi:hypothetical protein
MLGSSQQLLGRETVLRSQSVPGSAVQKDREMANERTRWNVVNHLARPRISV